LRNLLHGEGLKVVAEAWTEQQLDQELNRAQPDVALVDVRLEQGDGVALVSRIARSDQSCIPFVLTTSTEELDVSQALRAGAMGYALKETPLHELAAAIRLVMEGGAYLSPQVVPAVVGFVRAGATPLAHGHSEMSEREIDVLRLVARGLDNNEIAASLNISAKTVKNHVSSIFSKLELDNRVQAAVFAVRHGLA
jgi:DNA-binding NarL/FixJ family response regulator